MHVLFFHPTWQEYLQPTTFEVAGRGDFKDSKSHIHNLDDDGYGGSLPPDEKLDRTEIVPQALSAVTLVSFLFNASLFALCGTCLTHSNPFEVFSRFHTNRTKISQDTVCRFHPAVKPEDGCFEQHAHSGGAPLGCMAQPIAGGQNLVGFSCCRAKGTR